MTKFLLLTSYTKFDLNSLRIKEITIKLLFADIFGYRDRVEVRKDVMDCFAE